MSERKPIFLFSHPRSTSHAFLRPFLQRSQEFHVFCEPFNEFVKEIERSKDAKNGVADPSKHSDLSLFTPKVLSIFDDVGKTYYDESSNKPKRVLWHEHSVSLAMGIPEISFLSNPQFLEMTHTFLIRNPEKSIRSLYKAFKFFIGKSFDKNRAGLIQSKQIFDFLKDLNKQPIVIDSDDVINDPEGILKKYCELIGEEFKEEMIQWEAKPINEFKGTNVTISKFMVQ
ncbi:branched-chain-amino-acid aminotransferase-like protein 1 [Gigaspora margarita]|uniref:Branched-chain-amino-acid aminotransferase-like protein 1 n=1 Tax=Gigaspora margarita TaxID=4874 RepID=A0A8H4B1N6_GIGMA|nr:branched-chain-amino-acid aminotransferase-like protein 1 [Gigaspora margarita]